MAPSANVLLVEDDEELRGDMAEYLVAAGFAVHEAPDVAAARRFLSSESIEVVVLDVDLPGPDGLSLCKSIAATDARPAVLMLTALGEAVDRILGLELGADDYVVKPIPPRELLARIRALLRRSSLGATSQRRRVYAFEGFRLSVGSPLLTSPNGAVLLLTPSELAILSALAERSRTIVGRDELAELLNGSELDLVGRAIDLHISRLRRKIQDQAGRQLIVTCRGLGYMLDAKVVAE